MAQAIALCRRTAAHPADIVRMAIVTGCAVALIAAGQALPTISF